MLTFVRLISNDDDSATVDNVSIIRVLVNVETSTVAPTDDNSVDNTPVVNFLEK